MSAFEQNHKIINDRQEILRAIRMINDSINGRGFNFLVDKETAYRENEIPENALIVIASFDFSYYHDLELVFYDVISTDLETEMEWWDHWEKDQIELGEEDPQGEFTFKFNRGTHKDTQYSVRSKGFSYRFGTVFYYYRIPEGNQRLPWWVTR